MAYRLLCILLFACFITNGCSNESKMANQEPKTAEAKVVGDWLGQQYFSPAYIDTLQQVYPNSDRALLEKELNESILTPLIMLRFNADGTCESLTADGRPAKTGSDKWTLSKDGKTVEITTESPYSSRTTKMVNGKPVVEDTEGTNTSTMKLVLSDDGQTLSNPDDDERFGLRFLKAGSDAAKTAFKETPKPVDTREYAVTARVEDYVGTWTARMAMPQDMWEGARASMGEEAANKAKKAMEQVITLELRKDMTFAITTAESKSPPEGKWELENGGPVAVLTYSFPDNVTGPTESTFVLKLTADKSSAVMTDPVNKTVDGLVFKRKQ